MSSENPSGADNQQETVRSMFELDPRWVVGFVDGEGCFSVSIHRNPNARSTGGWQLHPCVPRLPAREASSGARSADLSVRLWPAPARRDRTAACGRTPSTRCEISRHTSSRSSSSTLQSSSVTTSAASPRSSRSMRRKEHLDADGFERLVRLAYAMNAAGQAAQPAHRRDPDGILRDCTPGPSASSVKIQSDPHGDMRSQAEMT